MADNDMSFAGRYARRALRALAPYSAGRDPDTVRRETGYTGPMIKLASNEGVEGPFPEALAAMQEAVAAARRYPEAGARALRHVLAGHHGVGAEEVFVAAGGCAVIQHLASAFLEPGDEVAYCTPTFHLYRLEALRMGAKPVTVSVDAQGVYDLEALRAAVTARTRLVYVCTPNNPTGGLIKRDPLRRFLDALPAHVLPVIDEAYFEYVDDGDYPDPARVKKLSGRPTVIVRTFSKMFGMAGLRIGYAIAPRDVVEVCQKVQNPYEVNRIAQAAALASVKAGEELARRMRANRDSRSRLAAAITALGLAPLPSHANFLCLRVGSARNVARALEGRGIIVRPLDAMGDPASIRITVGSEAEHAALLSALDEVLRAGIIDRS
ncbi:MAG TPA: histidinol-phosphate transaminase [Steroidobacteraceae bacterium]|nr:histidinol-phosphate transaminase [Steroidobacteraceae bacterium]